MAEGSEKISQLVINSPYTEPRQHWSYNRETRLFTLKDGRRAAGFLRASEVSQSFDDPASSSSSRSSTGFVPEFGHGGKQVIPESRESRRGCLSIGETRSNARTADSFSASSRPSRP